MATINDNLQETNNKLLNQDYLLNDTIGYMNNTVNLMQDGNKKLKDQSGKMIEGIDNNKNIKSKYQVTNKVWTKVKKNIFCKKLMLMVIIILLLVVDIFFIIRKLFN